MTFSSDKITTPNLTWINDTTNFANVCCFITKLNVGICITNVHQPVMHYKCIVSMVFICVYDLLTIMYTQEAVLPRHAFIEIIQLYCRP